MPDFAAPFARAGGLLGTALGPAASLLGTVSDAMSTPRRLAWGALGLPKTGSEVLSQKFGMDPESPWTSALGFGLELAGDPLTYVGLPLGSVGRRAGMALGSNLERAAVARPLGYADDMAKILPSAEKGVEQAARVSDIGSHPLRAKILGEVPEGSTFLGSGAEGFAMRTPQGHVVRIEKGLGQPPAGPLQSAEVLQPFRNVTAGDYRITHSPLVEALGPYQAAGERASLYARAGRGAEADSARRAMIELSGLENSYFRAGDRMREGLKARGLDPFDLYSQNVSRTPQGRWLTHDPNAIDDPSGSVARALSVELREPGRIQSALLSLLGGRGAVRGDLALAARRGAAGQGVELPIRVPEATALKDFLY